MKKPYQFPSEKMHQVARQHVKEAEVIVEHDTTPLVKGFVRVRVLAPTAEYFSRVALAAIDEEPEALTRAVENQAKILKHLMKEQYSAPTHRTETWVLAGEQLVVELRTDDRIQMSKHDFALMQAKIKGMKLLHGIDKPGLNGGE